MLYVMSNSYNPFYNLATEEYLLKQKNDDFFMLWRSEPTVIVGKHQNLPAEINYRYILENKLKVARRLTGGGTVVHDMQNLNFTFIVNGIPGKLIDFKKHITPIIGFLQSVGISASIGIKNDIRIGDLKISGNAEHVYKNRVLHHGTLLFNSDLESLRKAIAVVPGKYEDKAVQSNRASVVNIAEYLKTPMDIDEFSARLAEFVLGGNNRIVPANFSGSDNECIETLMQEKYSADEWIWGYSPRYTFRNSFEFGGKTWLVKLEVDKGKIQQAEVLVDGQKSSDLSECLKGLSHRFENLKIGIEEGFDFRFIGNFDAFVLAFF